MRNISELRQDIVSGDWVVIATGRGRRPQEFAKKDGDHWWRHQKKNCPFDELIYLAFYVDLKNGEIKKLSQKNKAVIGYKVSNAKITDLFINIGRDR